MNLQLSLKEIWFELTKLGIKTEDYREITEYWFKRLYTGINNRDSKSKDSYYILCNYLSSKRIDEANKQLKTKPFTIFHIIT